MNDLLLPLKNFVRGRYLGDLQSRIMKCVGEQFMYGQRETLLRYLELDRDEIFLAKIPHSGHSTAVKEGRVRPEFDWNGRPLLQAIWNSETYKDATSQGITNLVTIGATYLYSLANLKIETDSVVNNLDNISKNWAWSLNEPEQREFMRGKRVLILPSHSWEGDVNFKVGQRSKMLELCNSAEKIAFCLGYLDFLDPKKRLFYGSDHFIEIHCAGIAFTSILHSPAPARVNFFENLTNIFSNFDLVLGEELTTGLLYAACLGKQVGILSSEFTDSQYEKSTWAPPNLASDRRAIYRKQYEWLSSNTYSPNERFEKFYDELGIAHIKSKVDLMDIIPRREIVF